MINLKYYREFNIDLQKYNDRRLIQYFKRNFRKQFRIFNNFTFYKCNSKLLLCTINR